MHKVGYFWTKKKKYLISAYIPIYPIYGYIYIYTHTHTHTQFCQKQFRNSMKSQSKSHNILYGNRQKNPKIHMEPQKNLG